MTATTAQAKKTTKAKTEKKAEAPKADAFSIQSPVSFFEDFWTNGSSKAQEQFTNANASLEDVTSFQRETAEVLTETATLAQKGFEAIAAESATFTQKSYEDGVAAAKKTFATTNVQEAIELQTEFAKTAVDAYLGHMKKIGEMFQVSAQEVAAPINTRVTNLVETAQKAAF